VVTIPDEVAELSRISVLGCAGSSGAVAGCVPVAGWLLVAPELPEDGVLDVVPDVAFVPFGPSLELAGDGVVSGLLAGVALDGSALVGAAFGAGLLAEVPGTGVSGTPEPCLGAAGLVCEQASEAANNSAANKSGERFILMTIPSLGFLKGLIPKSLGCSQQLRWQLIND
jgi:hypothetical protein